MNRRCSGDDGQVAGIEGVTFGLLVFVIGALVIANGWGVIDAKFAASSAAREATRTVVESRRPSRDAALADARAAADLALQGYGRRLGARGRFVPQTVDYRRCGRVTIAVEYDVPLVALPFVGGFGHGFTAVGRHSEIVDPYRSGLAGEAACDGP